MAAVGGPILFSPLELNLEFSNLPFPPLGPGFSLRGVGGNQDSTRLGLSAAPPSAPSPTKGKRGRSWRLPGGQAGTAPAGLFSALGPAVCQMRQSNTSAWALDFTQPLSCLVCSATTPHTRSANILVVWWSPGPCLVSLETGQEQCQLSLAVFPSEPKAGAQGEWGAMLQGAGEVGRS